MKRSRLLGVAMLLSTVAAPAAALTFTPCGAVGSAGPTQVNCDAAYGPGVVAVAGGIQTWTVPATGNYLITATGAQGASGDPGFVGGKGAQIVGQFSLAAGQQLKLAVGQAGSGQSSTNNGGGGGGSFVVSSTNVPLLIAGGGGGTRVGPVQNGCDASVTQFAGTGSANNPSSACALEGANLGLGGIVSLVSWGSAGAGFNGDGATDPSGGGAHGGGFSWANGILGGNANAVAAQNAPGGFGAGGAGNGNFGGGGGGGYSGGDGGLLAGGGGSFNSGSSPSSTAGVGVGDGSIVILQLSVASVPALSDWAMILLAGLIVLGAVATLHRRHP